MLPLKQKCSSSNLLKIIGATLTLAVIATVMIESAFPAQSNLILYLIAAISCFSGSQLFEDFYLTEEFIEKGGFKIIHKHLKDVKQLL